MTRKPSFFAVLSAVALLVVLPGASPAEDKPQEKLKVVDTTPGKAPSDAVVLFDGHGALTNGCSYLCVRSTAGISTCRSLLRV